MHQRISLAFFKNSNPQAFRTIRIKNAPPQRTGQKANMTLKAIAPKRAPRKNFRDKTSKPGVYRKKASRNPDVPPAWEIGNASSFAKARSIAMERVCLDPKLGGKAKVVLANCLKRMNCHEQWSCFVSIPLLAEDSGTHEATCWRAIHDADGVYIATKLEWRSDSQQYPSTHITIHPNFTTPLAHLRAIPREPLASMQETARTDAIDRSHGCEENFLQLTPIKELPSGLDFGFEEKEEKQEGNRDRLLEFQNLATRKRGNREERFLPKASPLCRDLEFLQGREIRVEANGGYTGRWFDARELAAALGLEEIPQKGAKE